MGSLNYNTNRCECQMTYKVFHVSGETKVLFGEYATALEAANAALLIHGKVEVEINDPET